MVRGAPAAAEKILIVRVGRGGDLVMITPALDALLAAFPAAEFHLLTTGDGRRILAGYDPRITHDFVYTRRFPRTLFRQRELTRDFAAQGYTRIYLFETKPHYRNWLHGLAPNIHVLADGGPDQHYCDRCLDLVAASMPAAIARGRVSLPVTAAGRDRARELLTENGVDPDARLVALHPSFSGTGLPLFRDRLGKRHRMWPGASFAELARILTAQARAKGLPLALVIDALPGERAHVEPIVAQSDGAIALLVAPPDFQRYKALLSRMDVLVTPNTGPMHIAAAVGTPLVALFSNWNPADCGPYMDPARYMVLRAEDTTAPDLGLAAIAPDAVAGAVMDLLGRTASI